MVSEGLPRIEWTPDLVWIVVYQGLPATGLALWLQVSVLRSLPAVSTNLWLMLVPVVGLISSALIVGEAVTLSLVLGLVLIFAGVALNLGADRQLDEI
jgi:drug/metabolite transporter (DMT)-like permease